ncbi:MAG: hypothetical protein NTV17_10720 [Burkholderiales bacterium]|nr:hypothetical protein [Burkholderiales bacterium]
MDGIKERTTGQRHGERAGQRQCGRARRGAGRRRVVALHALEESRRVDVHPDVRDQAAHRVGRV